VNYYSTTDWCTCQTLVRDINTEVQKAAANLDSIQSCISKDGYSESLMNKENLAKISLEKALDVEEMFWQEKARVNWHCHGDRNAAFFHRVTKIK
jgi:N-acetyl-beta-hexosaminidase